MDVPRPFFVSVLRAFFWSSLDMPLMICVALLYPFCVLCAVYAFLTPKSPSPRLYSPSIFPTNHEVCQHQVHRILACCVRHVLEYIWLEMNTPSWCHLYVTDHPPACSWYPSILSLSSLYQSLVSLLLPQQPSQPNPSSLPPLWHPSLLAALSISVISLPVHNILLLHLCQAGLSYCQCKVERMGQHRKIKRVTACKPASLPLNIFYALLSIPLSRLGVILM